LSTLTTHRLTLNAKARRVTLDGRDFLVAPVVAATGGVMNGALATAEAFAESITAWEGMPITINHPQGDRGQQISAFSEGVVHVGFLASPAVDDKFRAEAWFDVTALQEAGEDGQLVITNLEAGELTEVSTGYFCDLEPKKGIYQGRVYFGVQHNIKPDHLAILPHEIGACSVADGCGIPRTNAATCPCKHQQTKEADVPIRTIVINEELSLTEQTGRVYDAWYAYLKTAPPVPSKAEDRLYVREVFADHVIVSGHPEGLLSYPYTTDAEGITFGEPVQVEIVYQPVGGAGDMAANANANALTWLQKIWSRLNQPQAQIPQRSEAMDRDITINKILAAEGNKFSKTTLQKLGDDELTQVEAGLATNTNPQPPTPELVSEPDPALTALTEAVKALTTKVDAITTNQQGTETAEKAKLVAELVANEACKLPEDVLTAMELPALRKAHAAYHADYSGRGLLRFNHNGVEAVEAPIMPMA
jgi:hypothetical protein